MSGRSTLRSTGPRKSSTGPACPIPRPSLKLQALPERDKRTLFASCVARTLKGQLAFEPKARPEVEATVARLGIDFAAAVRGNRDQVWTADLLWSRLRKDRILAIARETLGEAWAQAEAKQKKADIAKAMQDAFAHGDGVPAGITAESRAAAIAWTPPGFRAFDTGTVDDEGTASDEGTTAPEPQPAVADTPLGDAPEDDGPDPSGVEAETSQARDPEASAPADNDTDTVSVEAQQPMNAHVHSVVESIDAPAVAVRRARRARLGQEQRCRANGRIRAGSDRSARRRRRPGRSRRHVHYHRGRRP